MGSRILLAEDSPDDVRLFEYALEHSTVPHTLHVVQDGQDALDFLYRRYPHEGAHRPDVIMMDTNLAKVSGMDVLRQVKADEELLEIPVVVLSGSDTDARRVYKLHANCYVRKPSDLDTYIEAVKMIAGFWCGLVQLPKR
jgi:CheY-like chemotaxis protein